MKGEQNEKDWRRVKQNKGRAKGTETDGKGRKGTETPLSTVHPGTLQPRNNTQVSDSYPHILD